MKHLVRTSLIIAVLHTMLYLYGITGTIGFAQNRDSLISNFNFFSQYLSPEKLFVHLDRTVFVPGETVWLKGYLENSSANSLMPASNFIYAELLGDTVIASVMIKRREDGFAGYLTLPDSLLPGDYILRAYTGWNRNLPVEQMFYTSIFVATPGGVITSKVTARDKVDITPALLNNRIDYRRIDDYYLLETHTIEKDATLVLYNLSDIYYCSEVPQGKHLIKIDAGDLFPGVQHMLLLSGEGRVLAERTFSVFSKDKLYTQITFDKDVYGSRDKVLVNVRVTDSSGNPVKGEFSVSVVDSKYKDYSQEENIESYMLVKSELPGYDISSLWSGLPKVRYGKEYTQSLRGHVSTPIRKNSDDLSLSLIAPQIGFAWKAPLTGQDFMVDSLDFPDGTVFYAEVNKRGKRRVKITAYDRDIPPVYNYRVNSNKAIAPVKDTLPPIFTEMDAEATLLNEAIVRASAYYRPKHNPSPFGQYLQRDRVVERKELEKDDHRRLVDYIVQRYPGFYLIDGTLYNVRGSSIKTSVDADFNPKTIVSNEEPLLYIDGVKMESVGMLNSWSVRDVETLVVLRGNEGALYRSAWGVILVSARRSSYTSGTALSESQGQVLKPRGWQKPALFNAPVYDTPAMLNYAPPDYRTTLYWNPSVKTNEQGVAEFDFYTSDHKDGFVVRIEGMANNGAYIHAQKTPVLD